MIVTEADLSTLRHKHRGQRIVLALGTYDLLHAGHVEFLSWCKSQGDVLVVAVNNDLKVRHNKGIARPIIPEKDRLAIINALGVVDYSILADWKGGDYEACFIRFGLQLQPDIVCLSPEAIGVAPAWQAALPLSIIALDPQEKRRSTTEIIARVMERHGTK